MVPQLFLSRSVRHFFLPSLHSSTKEKEKKKGGKGNSSSSSTQQQIFVSLVRISSSPSTHAAGKEKKETLKKEKNISSSCLLSTSFLVSESFAVVALRHSVAQHKFWIPLSLSWSWQCCLSGHECQPSGFCPRKTSSELWADWQKSLRKLNLVLCIYHHWSPVGWGESVVPFSFYSNPFSVRQIRELKLWIESIYEPRTK